METSHQIFISLTFVILLAGCRCDVMVSISINHDMIPVTGNDITLTCMYSPIHQQRQITWEDNTNNLLASQSCTTDGCQKTVPRPHKYNITGDISSGNLTIMNLTRADGRIYHCIVQIGDDIGSSTVNLTILPPVSPDKLLLDSSGSRDTITNARGENSIIVFFNVSTSINCKGLGSRPAAQISWFMGDLDVTMKSVTSSSSGLNSLGELAYDTESILRIRPERRYHNINIRCVAHVAGRDSHEELRIIVYETPDPPEISIPFKLEDGVRTRLTCSSDNGYPSPMIHWYIGSRNVTSLSLVRMIRGGYERAYVRSTLEFTPSRADHGQNLTCRAMQMTSSTTLFMQSQNVSMVLDVLYKPVILELSFRQFVTDVTFSCRADANPSAFQFTWLHNGSSLNNTTENTQLRTNYQEKHSNSSSELTIQGVSSDDQGEYKCVTSTSRGGDSSVINYNFAFTPDAPSNLEVYQKQTTYSSITLVWQPGFYSGFQQTFTLQYCTNETQEPLEQKCDLATHIAGTNHTLTSLKPYTWYEITLWAANVAGNSSTMKAMASTARLNEPSFPSRKTPFMPIVLGVIVTAGFILLITLGLMYYYGVLCCVKRKKDDGNNTQHVGGMIDKGVYAELAQEHLPRASQSTTSYYMDLKPIPRTDNDDYVSPSFTRKEFEVVYVNTDITKEEAL